MRNDMDISILSRSEIDCIASSFLFSGVSEGDVLRALSDNACTLSEVEKHEVIFSEKSFQRSLGIVASGALVVTKRVSEGKKYIMNRIGCGSAFGVAAIFGEHEEYVTEICARERCKVVFFPQELLRSLMQEQFQIAENYICFLSGRIHFLNNKIRGLISVSAEQSVARYILENAAGESGITIPNSLSALAGMLNIGRASLYRALDMLESEKIISRAGKRIEILDFERLSNI